jgi:Amt family ammonium transporter
MICNGNLAGLVSVTGPCFDIEPWAAIIIGCIGGCLYVFTHNLLELYEIDDPIDVIPIHGACGLWGCISVGWFNLHSGIFYGYGGM